MYQVVYNKIENLNIAHNTPYEENVRLTAILCICWILKLTTSYGINMGYYQSIINHLNVANLPTNLNKFFSKKDIKKIIFFMMKDKKNNSDKINLILLKKIGYPYINSQYNKSFLYLFFKKELIN